MDTRDYRFCKFCFDECAINCHDCGLDMCWKCWQSPLERARLNPRANHICVICEEGGIPRKGCPECKTVYCSDCWDKAFAPYEMEHFGDRLLIPK